MASVKLMCGFVEISGETALGTWRGCRHGEEGTADVDDEEGADGEIGDADDANLGSGRGRKTAETKSARWPRTRGMNSALIV